MQEPSKGEPTPTLLLYLTLNTHDGVMMPEQELRQAYRVMRNCKPGDNGVCKLRNIQENRVSLHDTLAVCSRCEYKTTHTANHIDTWLQTFGQL